MHQKAQLGSGRLCVPVSPGRTAGPQPLPPPCVIAHHHHLHFLLQHFEQKERSCEPHDANKGGAHLVLFSSLQITTKRRLYFYLFHKISFGVKLPVMSSFIKSGLILSDKIPPNCLPPLFCEISFKYLLAKRVTLTKYETSKAKLLLRNYNLYKITNKPFSLNSHSRSPFNLSTVTHGLERSPPRERPHSPPDGC